jgi:putative CocE/NonD family hydrolase
VTIATRRVGPALPEKGLRDTLAAPLSRALGRALRLPEPLTDDVRVRRGFAIRTRDGVALRTDHYAPVLHPTHRGSPMPDVAPAVLVRTPYGRGGFNAVAARALASLGFHVIVSSCRGTADSGGVFDPLRNERDDGLDTVDWLRRQLWFDGHLGTFGPSYVGYTQWAIADVPELTAMATAVTASQFRDPVYAGASFALHTTLAWVSFLAAQKAPWSRAAIEMLRGQPKLTRALHHMPLGEADAIATGAEVEFFRRWLALAGADPAESDAYWRDLRHDGRVPDVHAPVLMVGGFCDIFLPWQLRDYAALRAAGARPQLTIGPWTHGSAGLLGATLRESAQWLRAHLRGDTALLRRHPVRVHVENGGWREYDDWPPFPGQTQSWFLHSGFRLDPSSPTSPSTSDRFRYDPADPTPSVSGPVLLSNVSRPRDNRALEARPDVLVYTSEVLRHDLEIVGSVSATIYVNASQPYLDVFVRLCDVAPDGVSLNVCDGLERVTPGRFPTGSDGVSAVDVEVWPAGHRFRAGHRLRVQVSGGAHPRYARNPGTDSPLWSADATRMRPVDVQIWRDADHPSAIRLPVPGQR